jgi:hypothetical protein
MSGISAQTYQIAVSEFPLAGKIQDGDLAGYRRLNGSFTNREIEPFTLAALIWEGYPFTTWHSNNWRHSRNFESGQHLGLDFDQGDKSSTLPGLLESPFVAKYASILYTTPSHSPAVPRARAVFLLDEPITKAPNYALAATALLWLFSGADAQCKDAARFFYGSKNCELEFVDRVLPLAVVRHLIDQYQKSGKRERQRQQRTIEAEPSDSYVAAALKNETENVRSAVQGTRNHTLNVAAFNLFRFIGTGQLSQGVIESALTNAALSAGLGETEIAATLRSALRSQPH